MRVIFIILLISHCLIGFSQDLEFLDNKMKSYSAKDSSNYSWIKKNCFLDLKFNLPTEFFKPRSMDIIYVKDPSFPDPDTIFFTDKNFLLSIAGFGLEPRMNFLNKKEHSIGLKTSLHMNFSVYMNFNNFYKNTGFFHLKSSMMMYFAKGLGAKYNNINPNGYSISAGVKYLIVPLSGGKSRFQSHTYEITEKSEEFLKNMWTLPCLQFDHYKLTKKNRIRNISVSAAYFRQNLFFQFNLGLTF